MMHRLMIAVVISSILPASAVQAELSEASRQLIAAGVTDLAVRIAVVEYSAANLTKSPLFNAAYRGPLQKDPVGVLLTEAFLAVLGTTDVIAGPLDRYLYVIPPAPGLLMAEGRTAEPRIAFRQDNSSTLVFLAPINTAEPSLTANATAALKAISRQGHCTRRNCFKLLTGGGEFAAFTVTVAAGSPQISGDLLADIKSLTAEARGGRRFAALGETLRTDDGRALLDLLNSRLARPAVAAAAYRNPPHYTVSQDQGSCTGLSR